MLITFSDKAKFKTNTGVILTTFTASFGLKDWRKKKNHLHVDFRCNPGAMP
jgi:hypothetical protein